ncbi:QueT transporter family protein [Helicovermis profundi]|uniref:QueT transporter family protein n=1 Tax=Helicovermis profundi TaxID=3065157 RepID=A0AAU9EPR7_9FIRM|nr:QueT transporter family protein [Clostridia bacterium S502]
MKLKPRDITKLGIVAALYFVLTVSFAPISYGNIQFRVSEVLTLFAFIDPFYILALVLGTFLSNLFSPLGVVDIIFGTLATFISVYLMSKTKNILVASVIPAIVNGLIIGIELFYLFKIPLLLAMGEVAFGEFVVVSIVGVTIFKYGILNNEYVLNIIKIKKD